MSIWKQKIKFILPIFLEILQGYSKFVILGTLWMLDISHEKSYHQSVGNFHAYMHARKINFITHFFLKILQRNSKLVIFGNLGMYGHTPKMIVSIWRNLCCLSASKNNLRSSPYSWDIPKILQFIILDTLGNPSSTHPKW